MIFLLASFVAYWSSATGHIKLTNFGISKIGPVNMTTEPHQVSILDIVREFTDGEVSVFSYPFPNPNPNPNPYPNPNPKFSLFTVVYNTHVL